MKKRQRKQLSATAQKKIVSNGLRKWLSDAVVIFDDGSTFTRKDVVYYTETPCTNAAFALHRKCKSMQISSLDRLFEVGHDALARVDGLGERSCLIAAFMLAAYGYNVDQWLSNQPAPGVMQWHEAIAARHRRPAVAKHRQHA